MDRLFTDYDIETVWLAHILHCTKSEPPWQHPCRVDPCTTVTVTDVRSHTAVSDCLPPPPALPGRHDTVHPGVADGDGVRAADAAA
jgi:hypothetical protein